MATNEFHHEIMVLEGLNDQWSTFTERLGGLRAGQAGVLVNNVLICLGGVEDTVGGWVRKGASSVVDVDYRQHHREQQANHAASTDLVCPKRFFYLGDLATDSSGLAPLKRSLFDQGLRYYRSHTVLYTMVCWQRVCLRQRMDPTLQSSVEQSGCATKYLGAEFKHLKVKGAKAVTRQLAHALAVMCTTAVISV